MADKIALIINDKNLYNRLSDNGIEAVRPFSKEKVTEEAEVVYNEFF